MKQKHSPGNISSLGARPKDVNGVVTVRLPHRNSSVLEQNPYQSMEVKMMEDRKAPPPNAVGVLKGI